MKSPLRILGLAAAFCLPAACGLGANTTTSDEAALEAADGVEYGATLDEFLEANEEHVTGELAPPAVGSADGEDAFDALQWPDLIPTGASYGEIRESFSAQLDNVEPGSDEAFELWERIDAEQAANGDVINPDVDGDAVRMSGFVAPITYDGEQITEFLLVPYFGACIHVPPPPANQTVMVTLAEGESLSIEESWGAVWVTGAMRVTSTETELASSSYSIFNAETGVETG